MANSKIKEAIRNAYVSKRNRNGQGDMLKDDRDAGPRIHRDDNTWTVATPEEFRAGMSDVARRGTKRRSDSPASRARSTKNDQRGVQQEVAMLLGGRRKKYVMDQIEGKDPGYRLRSEEQRRRMDIDERRGRDPSGAYNLRPVGHGSRTYSEQFTEPEDASRATNAEEAALLRERDRLDPYGQPTRKMRVQEEARKAIVDEFRRRRGGRR